MLISLTFSSLLLWLQKIQHAWTQKDTKNHLLSHCKNELSSQFTLCNEYFVCNTTVLCPRKMEHS